MYEDSEIDIKNTAHKTSFSFTKTSLTGTPLQGATFALYEDPSLQQEVAQASSSAQGVVFFDQLTPNATYYLKEIVAPSGYRCSNVVYTVTIQNDGTASIQGSDLLAGSAASGWMIANEKAYALPEVGSIGPTYLVLVGIGFLFLALLLYILQRRTGKSA